MKVSILLLLFNFSTLNQTAFADANISLAQPLFLKLGFSSIIDFSEVPERVVIGDSQSFQIEKINKSLVVRTLVPYANSNLFVYFKTKDPKIFNLTASEDAIPTTYKKIEDFSPKKFSPTEVQSKVGKSMVFREGMKLNSLNFNKSKDYLTLDFKITAGSDSTLKPNWNLIRLSCGERKIAAYKIWSQRKEIQKDSEIKARLSYLRPDIGGNIKKCYIILPLTGRSEPLKLILGGGK